MNTLKKRKRCRVYLGSKEHRDIGSRHELYVMGEMWPEIRQIIVSAESIRRLEDTFSPTVNLGVVDACYPVFAYRFTLKKGESASYPIEKIPNFKFSVNRKSNKEASAKPTKKRGITIIDRFQPNWSKEFKTLKDCKAWLMEGIMGCDGAERDHYVDMLAELSTGKTTLHYN